MEVPEFDIFAGNKGESPRWVESVKDLRTVRLRMEKLAAAQPGRYFAFSLKTHDVVLEVDTSARMLNLERDKPKTRDAA